jgi:hypothetical protein
MNTKFKSILLSFFSRGGIVALLATLSITTTLSYSSAFLAELSSKVRDTALRLFILEDKSDSHLILSD